MIRDLVGRSGVPSPLMRGNWCFTAECGHLHSVTLQEPTASQALSAWSERFRLPKGEAGPAVEQWFEEQTFIPKTVECKTCDSPPRELSFLWP